MAETPTIERLQKKLEKEPSPLIFLQLAEEYRKGSLYENALKVCRDGLKRHPSYWSIRVAVGRIHLEMGDLQKSREELEKVIKAVPDNLLANKLLGDIYLQQDRPADALKRYKLVQMITPGDQEVIANIQKIEGLSGQAPAPAAKRPEREPAPPFPAAPTVLIPVPQPGPPAAPTVVIPPPAVPFSLEKTEPGVKLPFGEETVVAPSMAPAPEPVAAAPIETDAIEQLMNEAPETHSGYGVSFGSPSVPEDESGSDSDFVSSPAMVRQDPPQMEDFSATELDSFEMEPLDEEKRREIRPEDRTQPMEGRISAVTAPAPAEPAAEEAEELTSQTLAELYVQQGLVDKAIRVYQKLLLHDPTNSRIIQRLKELSTAEPLLSSSSAREEKQRATTSMARTKEAEPVAAKLDQMSEDRRRKISTLENWLTSIRRERS